jgi:hypothetical protein
VYLRQRFVISLRLTSQLRWHYQRAAVSLPLLLGEEDRGEGDDLGTKVSLTLALSQRARVASEELRLDFYSKLQTTRAYHSRKYQTLRVPQ